MPATIKPALINANGDYLLTDSTQLNSDDGFGFSGTVSLVQSGTATWKLQYSPDGGVSKLDLKDQTGTIVTGTASNGINFSLGRGNIQRPISLYLNVTNVSGGTIQVTVHGN